MSLTKSMILTIDAEHPELLAGMEAWLQLGLLEEADIKLLASKYLTCPLPSLAAVPSSATVSVFALEEMPVSKPLARPALPRERSPNFLEKIWQGFTDELSVRWLLFLGLFLVVLSSGVLAATVWQYFPPVGQYAILLGYTLAFWAVSWWADAQGNLPLTRKTLQAIAYLLIPLNFVAIDRFSLWGNVFGWVAIAAAVGSLSYLVLATARHHRSALRWGLLFLGLSYLQVGWRLAPWPITALYFGTIGVAIAVRFFPRQGESAGNLTLVEAGFAIYALAVLLIRGIFFAGLPVSDLGLAIGICGWLLVLERFDRRTAALARSQIYELVGGILLFLAWLVCFYESFPWQATAVSGLAMHWLWLRVQRLGRRRELLALFLVGLQALFLIESLIPETLRAAFVAIAVQLGHNRDYPESLYSVTFFPYVLLFAALSDRLYRQERVKQARFGEALALALGMFLAILSIAVPVWRFLNLFFSAMTLGVISYRRPSPQPKLIYFTHFVGLLAIAAGIDWQFPGLSALSWSRIGLGLVIIEWGVAISDRRADVDTEANPRPGKIWRQSCWHYGFVLAGFSYLFFVELASSFAQLQRALEWLIVPLGLTVIADIDRKKKSTAVIASTIALILLQPLTVWQSEPRFISLVAASILMLVNVYHLPRTAIANIHLGFILALIATITEPYLSGADWVLLGAIATVVLWIARSQIQGNSAPLVLAYAQASDIWATGLCAVNLTALTLIYVSTNFAALSFQPQFFGAALLLGGGMIYRYWGQPNDSVILGIAWTIELVLVEILAFFSDSLLLLSAANVLLALGSLSLGNQGAIAPHPLARLSSFKLLPLVYGGIALSLRLNAFNAYTGLITLGVAIAGLGTGARLSGGKPLSYLSILGITCAIYELTAYQLLQGAGGSPADALTIFALVTAAIALVYRLGATLWHAQGRDRWLNFSLGAVKIIAHSHWALACLLKLAAASYALSSNPRLNWLSLSLSVALAAYALIQARDTSARDRGTAEDWWVYVGLVEMAATTVYARRLLADLLVLDPWRVLLVSLVSLVIYQLPWRSLGWEATPWRRFSLAIPALTLLATTDRLSYLSILAVAAFYARIALAQRNWRWSYLSLALIDWAIFRWLLAVGLTDFLYFASAIGASLLFIAQFDPDLQESSQKQIRHWLRLLGSGIIGLTAVLFHQETGLLPAALGLGFTFAGLGLQIRAFLWVGTATFLVTACYQLVILSVNYPFLKWVLGLAAGVILLSIGARFERHRSQIIVILHNWLSRLETWE